ncbi:MAG: hypothetical protein ACTSVO_02800 [Candidatus Heimdallarchaeaceae archaeon]
MGNETKRNFWKEFESWLFDGNQESELSEDVIRNINPRSILTSFSNCYELTIFLNECFNNLYSIFQVDPKEFYSFIKELVRKNRLSSYDRCFIREKKPTREKKIQRAFPNLKPYEIDLLTRKCEENEEDRNILDSLGIERQQKKVKKFTKAEKEELLVDENAISMNDWLKNFSE